MDAHFTSLISSLCYGVWIVSTIFVASAAATFCSCRPLVLPDLPGSPAGSPCCPGALAYLYSAARLLSIAVSIELHCCCCCWRCSRYPPTVRLAVCAPRSGAAKCRHWMAGSAAACVSGWGGRAARRRTYFAADFAAAGVGAAAFVVASGCCIFRIRAPRFSARARCSSVGSPSHPSEPPSQSALRWR